MALFSALKHRPFALLLAGQTVSRIGDHLYQLTLAWWVLAKTGSALDMGLVMVFSMAPMLVFLLIGGAAVDRMNKLAIMLASDVARALLTLVLALLAFSDALTLWHIYLASILFGCVDAFFSPAYAALVPQIVPRNDWPSANSLTSLSVQVGRIAGPPLAAGLIVLAGSAWGFALNSVSFFLSTLCLSALLPRAAVRRPLVSGVAVETDPDSPQHGPPQSGIYQDVLEGLAYVFKRRWLWVTILIFTLANVLLAGPYAIALPFLIQRTTHQNAWILGLLYAMFPVGYAAAAIMTSRLQVIPYQGRIIFFSIVAAGWAMAVLGLGQPLALLMAAAIINGFALEIGGLAWMRLLQENIPPGMLGRINSLDSLGSYALLPLGYAAAGWAIEYVGAPAVMFLGGGAASIIAIGGLLLVRDFAQPAPTLKWDKGLA